MGWVLMLLLGYEVYQHATSADVNSTDFAIYHRAAVRAAVNPDTLYRESTKGQPEDWIYPPPAILLIRPFAWFGEKQAYFAWMAGVYLSLAVCGLLCRRLRSDNGPPWTTILLFMALAPSFHAAKNGQIDPLVLTLCLGHLVALGRGRFSWAGVLLACGVWIKIYPCVLALLLPFRPGGRRVLAWFAAAMAAIPLIVAPLAPLRIEASYFLEYLPAVARITVPHIYNQSLIGFLTRQAGRFPEVLDSWAVVTTDPMHKTAAAILLALAAALAWRQVRAGGSATPSALLLLTVVPALSPLGWCHAYVYAIPAIAWNLRSHSMWARTSGAVAMLLFCLPGYRMLPLGALPDFAWNLGNSRFLLAALLSVGALGLTGPDPGVKPERSQAGGTRIAAVAATTQRRPRRRNSLDPSPPESL